MRNGSHETNTTDQLMQAHGAEARGILRAARIDRSQLRLSDACAAASVAPDELLAQLEAGLRRRIARPAAQPVEEHEYA